MYERFFAQISVPALTLATIEETTGLNWIEVDFDAPNIPSLPGVYVWVESEHPNQLWYHGKGSGRSGLRGRLHNQLKWRRDRLQALETSVQEPTEQNLYNNHCDVPFVQQSTEGRRLFYAIATPAPWSIPRNEIVPPMTAEHWEDFISAVSLLVVGHRGLIGGGAWEDKSGSYRGQMTDLAWDRLVDLEEGWEAIRPSGF